MSWGKFILLINCRLLGLFWIFFDHRLQKAKTYLYLHPPYRGNTFFNKFC